MFICIQVTCLKLIRCIRWEHVTDPGAGNIESSMLVHFRLHVCLCLQAV